MQSHWVSKCLKNSCVFLAHTLWHRVCNHISISLITLYVRLPLSFSMHLPYDASKFFIRNGSVLKITQDGSLVWLYEFPMPHIGTMTLWSWVQYKLLAKHSPSPSLTRMTLQRTEYFKYYLHSSPHISTMRR